ncbi:MAG TPA: nucleotidyltransferase [Halothiobacillaceae bacterium]|nr:nucleotidyltransferase [Halothiobacillaceae bacterium]
MTQQDIRWLQRFSSFNKALGQLSTAVALGQKRELSELEKQGLIQAFEYTYELAWHMIRDYFRWQGNADIVGSRDAFREAFANGLISDGDGWMRMLKDRNRTSHTYNEQTAQEILDHIFQQYYPLFTALQSRMEHEAAKHNLT